MEACVERELPVLGLCWGQALAAALGGEVRPLGSPELGWHRVDSDARELVAPGPWLQWHHDAFTVPTDGVEIARSAAGAQAFLRPSSRGAVSS
jgi:GMP synthase-like glutamine amidotransferase